MPILRNAKPVLGPLITWSKTILEESKKIGLETDEAVQHIKIYGKDRGWTYNQINLALRYNGIRKKRPSQVVCPRCEDVGNFCIFHHKGKTKLVIVHGKLYGFWGKSDKPTVRRRRRCYFGRLTEKDKQRLLDQMYEKLDLIRKYGA